MKKALKDFWANRKNIAIWTVQLFALFFILLFFALNFNVFNSSDWNRLFGGRIFGLQGFIIWILFLIIFPIYIGVIKTIIATKNPIIKLPKLIKKSEKKSDEKTDVIEAQPEIKIEIPSVMPPEMIGYYARMKRTGHTINNQQSLPTQATNDAPTTTQDTSSPLMPLPSEFDFEKSAPSLAPSFSEFSFDAPKSESVPSFKNISFGEEQSEYVVVHDDDDFWATDDENWFAKGKQKPSPIKELLTAKQNGKKPILHLKSTNIMDLENREQEWENLGIIVKK